MTHVRISSMALFLVLLIFTLCFSSCTENVKAEKEGASDIDIMELNVSGEKVVGEGLTLEYMVTGNVLSAEEIIVDDLQSMVNTGESLDASSKCVCSKGNKCCCGPNGTCCNSPGRCCCSWPVQ